MAACNRSHECEIFTGRFAEAAESQHNWKTCERNPGHGQFVSALNFIDNFLPRVKDGNEREKLRSLVNRTVRLRVRRTSQARSDDDEFSADKGTNKLRVGTGFIYRQRKPVFNKPCQCHKCGGKIARKQLELGVLTARHVVFNSEEAKNTVLDLFYDDTNGDVDGTMKSAQGLEVLRSDPDRDVCYMTCVTCDEDVGERIESFHRFSLGDADIVKKTPFDLGLLRSHHKHSVMIISHPHAQPKQISAGFLKHKGNNNDLRQYTTLTCPGSSGAPVFVFDRKESILYWFVTVHNGSYKDTATVQYMHSDRLSVLKKLLYRIRGHKIEQLNFGHLW